MGQYDIFLLYPYFVHFRLVYNGLLVEGRLVHNVETPPRVKKSFIPFSFQIALLYKIKFEKNS